MLAEVFIQTGFIFDYKILCGIYIMIGYF